MPSSFKQWILISGAVANLLTVLLYTSAVREDSDIAIAVALFGIPLLWIITMLIAVYLIWTYRTTFKSVTIKLFVMLLFIFCTPIPIALLCEMIE